MNSGTRRANSFSWAAALLLVSALVAASVYVWGLATRTGQAASPPQDVIRIESRLSLLEQRFYSMEASIRSLEQQLRLSSVNTGRVDNDREVSLLRSEVEALRRRLAEVECGLARVDERTLNATAREARRKAEAGMSHPCRLNADAPVQLPARP